MLCVARVCDRGSDVIGLNMIQFQTCDIKAGSVVGLERCEGKCH